MASRESKHTATESGFLNNVYVLSCFETRHKYSHLSRCPGESTLCCAKSLHHIQFFETLWTIACLAPVSMGSSRQEYWSGVAMPSSRGSFNPGIKPRSPTLQAASLPAEKGSPAILEWVPYPFCSRSSNTGIKLESLLHCRPFLYQLSCQGRPEVDGVSNRN